MANRAHRNGEYFILEKHGVPIAGVMNADEPEDYLELHDPKVRRQIAASRKDAEAGRVREASALAKGLKKQVKARSKAARPRH